MKRLLALLLLCLFGCANLEFPTLLDRESGVSFKVPTGWSVASNAVNNATQSAWTNSSDEAKLEVTIDHLNPAQVKTAKDIQAYGEDYVRFIEADRALSEVDVRKHGILELAGTQAYEYIYTAQMNGESRWFRLIQAVHPEDPATFFTVTCSTPAGEEEQYLGKFDDVVDTWEWKEIPKVTPTPENK